MKQSRFCHVLAVTLILSLVIPLPLAGSANARVSDNTPGKDPGRMHVLKRLNSPERKAAIAEAKRLDAAAREAFGKSEEYARGEKMDRDGPSSPLSRSPLITPQQGGTGKSTAVAQFTPNAGQGASGPLQDARVANTGSVQRSLVAGGTSNTRPRSMTEVMFNGVTGFMGMPGLAGSQYAPYAPSLGGAARRGSGFEGQGGANLALPGSHMLPQLAWNEDQGLGFHADGTARRADGTTGSNAASSTFDGRRAASYAGSGLGYGAGGMRGGMGDMNGYYGPGYDPTTGSNFRYGDSTSAAYHARQGGANGAGGGSGLFNMNDPQSYFMQRGLNYGMGLANSAAEGLFLGVMESPYGGAKARLNFMMDIDGRINGEGDVLLPFYDSKYTTVFTQLGARSMSGMSGGGSDGRGADRWIGNFGLGQRWYPMAVNDGTGQDAGNFMLGYNVFFDNDFTRSHQRGGAGIEAQYDWMHLASNYYMPLSGWKGSKDFDSNFVKERAAEGWDIRAKGYLPFYRNVALTGAYTQWKGDHVGMFSSRKLEKDPSVWSYGMEYTPIPLVSGFVNQRSTEQGRSDTEFGLRMTYTFSMPWDQQTSHAKVAETRTVGGSRHEFVDRENRIILEYKAKNNFAVEYLGMIGTNTFKFRLKHPLDGYVAGQVVKVTAGSGVTLAEVKAPAPTTFLAQAGEFISDLFSVSTAHAADFSQTYTTDRNGEFIVKLDNVTVTPVVLTIQAGNSNQSVTLHDATVTSALSLTRTDTQALSVGLLVNNVTFALADTNTPASVQSKSITLAWSGAGAFDTPPAIATTDGSGKFTLNLKGLTAGASTLTVTLPDGRKATYDLTVAASALSLARTDTQALSVGLLVNNVTFALADTNTPASVQSKSITLAWSGAGAFDAPPAIATTDGSGKFTLNLKGLTAGASTLTVTLPDGRKATYDLTVAASALSLTRTDTQALSVGLLVNNVTFTLADTNTPASVQSKSITLAWSGAGAFDAPPASATTDGSGKFTLNLKGLTAGASTLTVTLPNGKTVDIKLSVGIGYAVTLTPTNGSAFSGGTSTASVTATVTKDGNIVSGENVTWSLTASTKDASAVSNLRANSTYYGLAWGASGTSTPDTELTGTMTSATNGSGQASIQLTDIVGERSVTIQASIGSVTQTAAVTFGKGPLAKFKAPLSILYTWTTDTPVTDSTTNFPAAAACGGTVSYTGDMYYASSNLPSRADLNAVSTDVGGKGAWQAAGWLDEFYWTGEAGMGNNAFMVYNDGFALSLLVTTGAPVVCLRLP